MHGGAEGPLEPVGELLVVGRLVKVISKRDLLVVVPRQQTDLVSEKVGREIKS